MIFFEDMVKGSETKEQGVKGGVEIVSHILSGVLVFQIGFFIV